MAHKFTNLVLEIYRYSVILDCQDALLEALWETRDASVRMSRDLFEKKQEAWRHVIETRKATAEARIALMRKAVAPLCPGKKGYTNQVSSAYQGDYC